MSFLLHPGPLSSMAFYGLRANTTAWRNVERTVQACREEELVSPYFLSGTKNLSLLGIRRYSLRACRFCFLSSLLQYSIYTDCIIGLLSLAYLQWILVALKKVPSFSGEKTFKAKKVWAEIFYFLIVLYVLPQIWVCLCSLNACQ